MLTEYEEELEGNEEREDKINLLVSRLPPDDPLVGQERDSEENIDRHVDHLVGGKSYQFVKLFINSGTIKGFINLGNEIS